MVRALKVEKKGVSQEVRMIDEKDILLISDNEPDDSDSDQAGGIYQHRWHGTDDQIAW
jgi:hypothetical protein